VYDAPNDPNGGYVSSWFGDAGSKAAPQLGLFFPVTLTFVPNYLGPGVGNDPSNLANLAARAGCSTPSNCYANWTAVPTGALSWYSAPMPAPYVTLPLSAWPSCPGGVMRFAGGNYTTTAGAAVASAAKQASAGAAVVALAAALATVLAM
jgi:hypothetical protein